MRNTTTIDDLMAKIEELIKQVTSMQSTINALQKDNENLRDELAREKLRNKALSINEVQLSSDEGGNFSPIKKRKSARNKKAKLANAQTSNKKVETPMAETPSTSEVNKPTNEVNEPTTPTIDIKTSENMEVQEALGNEISMDSSESEEEQDEYIEVKKKSSRPPAIIAYHKNAKLLQTIIKKATGTDNTTLYVNTETVKIQCIFKEEFYKVAGALKEKKIQYYTFTPKEDKPISLMVKNICTTYDEEEIQTAIENKGDIKVLLVKHIKMNNWLVQVADRESAEKLTKIRGLLGLGIKVEKYRGAKILQCKNCQRFNHLAINCNMPYRCIKCTNIHGPGQCPIPKKEENTKEITIDVNGIKKTTVGVPIACVNCGKQHPANYGGCEYRKKMVLNKKVQRSPQRTTKTRNIPAIPTNFRTQNISYSQMAKANTNQQHSYTQQHSFKQQQQTVPNVQRAGPSGQQPKINIEDEVNKLFGKSVNTCLDRVMQFLPNYNTLNENQQRNAWIGLLVDLCQT
jgi:hypothetical protein